MSDASYGCTMSIAVLIGNGSTNSTRTRCGGSRSSVFWCAGQGVIQSISPAEGERRGGPHGFGPAHKRVARYRPYFSALAFPLLFGPLVAGGVVHRSPPCSCHER